MKTPANFVHDLGERKNRRVKMFPPIRQCGALAAVFFGAIFPNAPLAAQSVRYEVVEKKWDASLGTHRAVVKVAQPAEAVRVHLEWRRRDSQPEAKAVVVVDAATGQRVTNAVALDVSAEAGDLVFQPVSGAGEYFAYFLPGNPGGGSFPAAKYLPPQDTAAAEWMAKLAGAGAATVVRWEARTEHDRFNEMEIIATAAEKQAWLAGKAVRWAIFVEDAAHSVRMFDHVPERWLQPRGRDTALRGGAGEPVIFQLGVWAAGGELKNVRVQFGDLAGPAGGKMPAGIFRGFNEGGTDWLGHTFTTKINVSADRVQPLWCVAEIPANAARGRYTCRANVTADGGLAVPVAIEFLIGEPLLPTESALTKLKPLRWLDSTIAQEPVPTKPFTPLRVEGGTIHCLGRSLTLGPGGLPAQIASTFTGSVTAMTAPPRAILAGPMRFVVTLADGRELALKADAIEGMTANAGVVSWRSGWQGDGLGIAVGGRMEFDGQVELRCELRVTKAVEVRDIRLEIPRTADTCKYAIGLGLYGGLAPAALDWKWDVAKRHQDALWLGDVNAGLRVQLRAENYARPMVNIHYPRQPLNDPPSWSGGGAGGIRVAAAAEKTVLFTASSGPRTLAPGTPLHFDYDLSITPFKPLNTEAQWRDRYYHVGGVPAAPEKVRELGANIVNIHQGNALNPYINYPFLTAGKLRDYADRAHAAGLRVKYYYTVRELTNWTPELFALRSFGDELIAPGKGGGHAWCEEHLGGNYWGAWYEPGTNDASILTMPMSRFHNFYLEGLHWLTEHAGCDGIYLDDISYDRTVTQRARRILDGDPRGGLIDLHSWNEMNGRAGFASCALIFMDSLPYVDRLWFGEGHHCDGPPEQTLVAISGVPFGMMGEMLEGGGNPWLGLTFGMTGRLGWGGNPQPVWKLWDEFGVAGSEFNGWWDAASPVKASAPECRATIWRQKGKTLIAVGNFGDQPVRTTLAIDFTALGLDAKRAHLYAPEMKGFQPELLFAPDATISIAPKRGFAFILDETPRQPVKAAATLAFDNAKLLFEDTFVPQPKEGWKIVASPKIGSAKPDKEGLVFLAPANVHAWAERALPPDTAVVAAQIRQDAGDEAQQWGPGLALVWPDGNFLKAGRRKDGRFGLSIAGAEKLVGMCDIERPVTISFVLEKYLIRIVASGEGVWQQDQELARIPRTDFPGVPAVVRVGKMPNSGEAQDHSDPGPPGWSRADWLRLYR